MDHIVYLDHKARELINLSEGRKNMILRGAMGRKLPYGRVTIGDLLYFVENNGSGIVKATARVKSVFNSEKLTREASHELVESKQEQLQLNAALMNRFAGKRFLVLIEVDSFKEIESFRIDRSEYTNMDDWLPVGDIMNVR